MVILLEVCGGFAPLKAGHKPEPDPTLFALLPAEHTHIHFSNLLPEINEINILKYQYFYNGGGVAIGDINNDGLADIYFTGNLVANRLYLNRGNLQFEDITEKAGVAGGLGWTTGTTMADVNGDGFLDIYVCRSGNVPEKQRTNKLYVNNGDLTFNEQALHFGLADPAYSTQAAFFDYDLDGDLDMFLLNHAITSYSNVDLDTLRRRFDPFAGDKLFRNDDGNFSDVSRIAGIRNNPLGFGLGVAVGDLNNDGLSDIYVANDFLEQDYLYFNDGDGSFTEEIKTATGHTSLYSMGTDIADFNNDGRLDVVVVDMVAEDNYRQKTNMSGMNREKFHNAIEHGFHYQYMINTLQLNNGQGHFSEIAHLAGIPNTDWSWAPLFVDVDNDGRKDLFITNGYRRDATNNDYINFLRQSLRKMQLELQYGGYSNLPNVTAKQPLVDLVKSMPSQKIANYLYRNNGDLTFTKMTQRWGVGQPSFSNGAAFGDLDNDGDMDLVVNNIDAKAFVYRNDASHLLRHHYLDVRLSGPAHNRFGIGSRIEIKVGSDKQVVEIYPTRGYQSAGECKAHFGLGRNGQVDELVVRWPSGRSQVLRDVAADRTLYLSYENASIATVSTADAASPIFLDATARSKIKHLSLENTYDDFIKEPLLPHKMSNFGPGVATGDVNGDGLEDFYIGGAQGFPGKLYLQSRDATFIQSKSQPWVEDRGSEDLGCSFFDADGDEDLDLYVVSGGNEFDDNSPHLQDRLYRNDGAGLFKKTETALPEMRSSGSCVRPADYDRDGDLDLFVGGRVVPGKYPFPPRSYLLRNEGGRFTDATPFMAAALQRVGLVTDAVWTDYNQDGLMDLIVVGEWLPVTVMKNEGSNFVPVTDEVGLGDSNGWWFSIAAADIDQDGDEDYVVGNLGLNYKYRASREEPFHCYAADFDRNGTLDIMLGKYDHGQVYPLRGRECSSEQMPFIKEKYPTYRQFARATIEDVVGQGQLDQAMHLEAKTFATVLLENQVGSFQMRPLPIRAQLSSVNAILIDDFNADKYPDVVLAGNLYASEVETPRNDAGMGLFLVGNGKGDLIAIDGNTSGLFLPGDVKDLAFIKLGIKQRTGFVTSKNNDSIQLIEVDK